MGEATTKEPAPDAKRESTPGAVAMASDGVDQVPAAKKIPSIGVRASRARHRPSTLPVQMPSQLATLPGAVNSTSGQPMSDKKSPPPPASQQVSASCTTAARRGLGNKKGVNDASSYHSDMDSSVESQTGLPRVRRRGRKKQPLNGHDPYASMDTSGGEDSQPGFVRVRKGGRGLRRKKQQGDLGDTSADEQSVVSAVSAEPETARPEMKDFSEQEIVVPTNSFDEAPPGMKDFSEQEIHIPTKSFDEDFSEQEIHVPTNSIDGSYSEQDIAIPTNSFDDALGSAAPEIVMQTDKAVLESPKEDDPEARPGAVASTSADHRKNHPKSHFVSQGSSGFLMASRNNVGTSGHARTLRTSNNDNTSNETTTEENARQGEIEALTTTEPRRQPEEEENPMYTPFPDGENHKTKGRRKHNQSVLLVVGVFVLVAIIVATVVSVVIVTMGGNGGEGEADSQEATGAPKAETDLALIPGLPESTLEALADLQSPQRKALDWLLGDPILDEYEDWQKTQRFALATFFHAMGGPRWGSTAWLNYDTNECQWTAEPDACNEDGSIINITITQQRGFKGSLPPEMALLTSLTFMDFSNNIISSVANLFGNNFTHPFLQAFHCSDCRLSGSFPMEVAQLTNLRGLVLNSNDMAGLLPSEIAQMSLLLRIELEGNQFSGAIPSTIGDLQQLEWLDLSRNDFSYLPSEVGRLTKVAYLDLDGNKFHQTVPSELGAMSQMQILLLGTNLFEGTIPSQVIGLSNLGQLHLTKNSISGTIPEMLGSLTTLRWLGLGVNKFSGVIPSELGQLTGLSHLDLGGNSLTSTIPSELGRLVLLEFLAMFNNDFSGSIPREFANLSALDIFNAKSNPFTVREIPEQLCAAQTLIFDWCEGSLCCAQLCECWT